MPRMFTIALLASSLALPAFAATETFHAKLDGASEVPPKASKGSGEATGTLDTATKTLTYTVTFSGLSGPATAAHFHGPAAAGASAGPIVTIGASNPTSPIKGQATLTDAQISELNAGKLYVNVHTQADPGGEIRGQMLKGM